MRKRLHLIEHPLLVAGLTMLFIVGAAQVHRSVSSRRALMEFDRAQTVLMLGNLVDDKVDFSLWSEKRLRAFRESLLIKKGLPMAVLSIARLKIRVPVYEGTDDLVLNRGVGWIPGTGRPGAVGNNNIGIAGHRDGFFRAFKDIEVGDAVELSTLGMVSLYKVDSVEIVNPENVGVLRPRGVPSLTLATCYPFYFVGDAPQRFIVHATLKQQIGIRKLQDSGSPLREPNELDSMEKNDD